MGLDYVDIFYSHRFDPDTPLEETIGALDTAVRQGKALYAGISSYGPAADRGGDPAAQRARHAAAHPPAVLLHVQPLDRGRAARRARPGGRRRDRLLAAGPGPAHRQVPRRHPRGLAGPARHLLRRVAAQRGEPRAGAGAERDRRRRGQTSPSWRSPGRCATRAITSVLLGASSVEQLEQNVAALRARRLRSRPSSSRSTVTRSTAASTSGSRRARA